MKTFFFLACTSSWILKASMMKSKSILPMPFFQISRKEIFFCFFLRRWKPAVAFVVFEGLKRKGYTLLFLALDSASFFFYFNGDYWRASLLFYMKIHVLLNPIVFFFLFLKKIRWCVRFQCCAPQSSYYTEERKASLVVFHVEDPESFSDKIFLLEYRR
jgi:hypothetical protein